MVSFPKRRNTENIKRRHRSTKDLIGQPSWLERYYDPYLVKLLNTKAPIQSPGDSGNNNEKSKKITKNTLIMRGATELLTLRAMLLLYKA